MAFYKDIDLAFEKNEQNDINSIYNENAIRNSLKNIILPKRTSYNRFQLSTLGTNISRLLGERPSKFVAMQLEDEVAVSIANYESRIRLQNIVSILDDSIGVYELRITYLIVLTKITDTLTVNLSIIT